MATKAPAVEGHAQHRALWSHVREGHTGTTHAGDGLQQLSSQEAADTLWTENNNVATGSSPRAEKTWNLQFLTNKLGESQTFYDHSEENGRSGCVYSLQQRTRSWGGHLLAAVMECSLVKK